RREPGDGARERRALDRERELRLGVRALRHECLRQGRECLLRSAPGAALPQARGRARRSGRGAEERPPRRRARGVRAGGARYGATRNGRRTGDCVARSDPRRPAVRARRAPRRGRRDTRRGVSMKPAAVLAALLGAAIMLSADAQEGPFPQKGSIELTVLFPAGSSADITARLLAEGMSKNLPGNVIVVNRPGAGGAVGYRHVASQKPDGYSLVWNSNSISTTYYSGLLPFDYKAFDPVARALVESPVLAVRSDSTWKTLADFLADAKARPGKITVGNSGVGSHTHISSVALFKAAGVEVVDVPYAAAQVVPSLLGGHIDAVIQLPGALAIHVKAGTIRLLAALIPQRDPALPD